MATLAGPDRPRHAHPALTRLVVSLIVFLTASAGILPPAPVVAAARAATATATATLTSTATTDAPISAAPAPVSDRSSR